MDSLKTTINFYPDCFIASIDRSNACYHILIHPESQVYLRVAVWIKGTFTSPVSSIGSSASLMCFPH
ncbi:hypothetical protein GDO81_009824 [Engystomops pustulosus]|uniref:Uncharacterized protein n=1 Tax=Engystomops pustulosus TaxID=76066 RepID=A0AAV7BVE3_ENGPU|nr:hypothetical protein GDO81_009824 [Engystomops pustulosus]